MNFSITPNTYEPENAYDLKIYDNILPKVTYTIFLGVILTTGSLGKWDHHIKALWGRGSEVNFHFLYCFL